MGNDEIPADQPLPVRESALDTIAGRGLAVPGYDRAGLRPRIVHIGVGGFHRAHLAVYCHELAELGGDWGIHGIGLLAGDEPMAAALAAQDHLYTVTERGDGETTSTVVGSLIGYTWAPPGTDEQPVIDRIADPDTAIVSMTVTEGGYTDEPRNLRTFDLLAAGLAARWEAGRAPVTVMSCDNVTGNGGAARRCTLAAAARRSHELAAWVAVKCAFPNSMVDRITPATTPADRSHLERAYGVDDRFPVVCEPFRQWVLEDHFASGRPEFERVGVLYSDDVHAWELYKLRMLNAGHSTIAYLSALAGFELVDEAMAANEIRGFLHRFLHTEAVPSLDAIPGHPREDYADQLTGRFANPGVRDQVARLCLDGTAKFPTFLTPTIEGQLASGGPIGMAALALAGWAHYLSDVPIDRQAADPAGEDSRRLARLAVDDPAAFLALDAVFTEPIAADARFADAFVNHHRAIAERGVLTAIADALAAH